jgi:hypothetical protein
MEKVLRMMNVPTNRATPANTSRKTLMNCRLSDRSAARLSACSAAVLTSYSAPASAATRSLRTSSLTPSAAAMLMPWNWPGAVSSCCAVSVSKAVSEAPAKPPSSPKRKVPTTSASTRGPGVSTVMRSPTE